MKQRITREQQRSREGKRNATEVERQLEQAFTPEAIDELRQRTGYNPRQRTGTALRLMLTVVEAFLLGQTLSFASLRAIFVRRFGFIRSCPFQKRFKQASAAAFFRAALEQVVSSVVAATGLTLSGPLGAFDDVRIYDGTGQRVPPRGRAALPGCTKGKAGTKWLMGYSIKTGLLEHGVVSAETASETPLWRKLVPKLTRGVRCSPTSWFARYAFRLPWPTKSPSSSSVRSLACMSLAPSPARSSTRSLRSATRPGLALPVLFLPPFSPSRASSNRHAPALVSRSLWGPQVLKRSGMPGRHTRNARQEQASHRLDRSKSMLVSATNHASSSRVPRAASPIPHPPSRVSRSTFALGFTPSRPRPPSRVPRPASRVPRLPFHVRVGLYTLASRVPRPASRVPRPTSALGVTRSHSRHTLASATHVGHGAGGRAAARP